MISQKIVSLRYRLKSIGLDANEIDSIVEEASEEIRSATLAIVEKAVYEAEDYGSSIGAEEFLSQIRLDASSGYIEISTDSGKTDFSTPPFPMLPWLLNKAKVAKDGSRYRVVPVGGDSSNPKPVLPAKDIASGLQAMSTENFSISNMAERMTEAFGLGASSSITDRQRPVSSEKPEFRVASSKQDAARQWVAPARSLDMTGTLMTLNATIRSEIDSECEKILNKYEAEAKKWRG
jgi:hypothetical protein